jgi:hypothetical protein
MTTRLTSTLRLPGPFDKTARKSNAPALRQNDLQAAFAGIALSKSVGGDHAQPPAGLKQGKAAAEECRA